MWPNKNITTEELEEFRHYIADELDARIKLVTAQKLDDWFGENVRNVVEDLVRNNDALRKMVSETVSEEFERIMIVKLKGN